MFIRVHLWLTVYRLFGRTQAQVAFDDLAVGVAWEWFFLEGEIVGHLVVGQVLAAVSPDVLRVGGGVLYGDEAWTFSPSTGSGLATTADSATAGWWASTLSTSALKTL